MADDHEPRRWKLPSELDDSERDASRGPGADGQVERDEYVVWRRETLRDERDDLALRGRLLEEEAQALRARAAKRTARALSKLTPADWADRRVAEQEGRTVEPIGDDRAAELEQQAAELEQQANEIAEHTPAGAELSAADHAERKRNAR